MQKWFNSPTDNMFSPCSKKLNEKHKAPAVQGSNLLKDISDTIESSEGSPEDDAQNN